MKRLNKKKRHRRYMRCVNWILDDVSLCGCEALFSPKKNHHFIDGREISGLYDGLGKFFPEYYLFKPESIRPSSCGRWWGDEYSTSITEAEERLTAFLFCIEMTR